MSKENKDSYSAVDKIINECERIECSENGSKSYDKLIDLINRSFFPEADLKTIVNEAIKEKGEKDSVYHYCIGLMIQRAHSSTPEYEGKEDRENKIEEFVNDSKYKMCLDGE